MVEGTTAYRFTGTAPTEWTWTKSGAATRGVADKTLSIDIDANLLPARAATAAVVLRALSADYQTVLATLPPAPAKAVDLSDNAAPTASDRNDADAATFTATARQDGTDLVIKVEAAAPADLNTVLLFFDNDGDAKTGFAPPADPRFGFEMMIQGGSLSSHAGPGRDAWAWTTVSPVKQTIDGKTAEIRFNASLLKSSNLKMAAWQMSPDWQTKTNSFPQAADGKAATADVRIDATKLRAATSSVDMPLAPVHANAALPPRQRFAEAKSYACYYGAAQVGSISHVDAAILHIPAMTQENVKTLNKVGVVTIGYISVGEDETVRVANGKGFDGKASWYFDKDHDGKPDANGVWGSYYANAADPEWRADRVAQAKLLCDPAGYGFQGIFLDTIETVDAYPASRAGMIKLVEELRAALPDKVIVINRGFSLLKESAVSGNIDGLMYESFTSSYDFDTKRYIRFLPQDMDATRATMVSNVMPAMKEFKLKVLALDYTQPDQADRIQEDFDRAASFGMLPAVSSISLDMVYDTSKVVAKPDEKFLAVQATPASMQAKLTEARNGFPAGTIIQPSSCFMGYQVATVVDGIADHRTLIWTKAAWASAEQDGTAQSLLFQLPQAVSGGKLKITFAYDNKAWFPSRDFTIETSADGTTWKSIAHPTANSSNEFTCPLPTEPIGQLRITQSPGGGSTERPNLMWVQQVTLTP
ncbi:MAG: hypothetical protein JWM57_3188, partial [Phycisphaerales bacterium]|nr:hypothetical protein [Phycisphaerales bacterium]